MLVLVLVLLLGIADQGAGKATHGRANERATTGVSGLPANQGAGARADPGAHGRALLGRRATGEGKGNRGDAEDSEFDEGTFHISETSPIAPIRARQK